MEREVKNFYIEVLKQYREKPSVETRWIIDGMFEVLSSDEIAEIEKELEGENDGTESENENSNRAIS